MKAGDQLGARERREYRDGILSHPSATTLGCVCAESSTRMTNESIKCHPHDRIYNYTYEMTRLFHVISWGRSTSMEKEGRSRVFRSAYDAGAVRKILAIKGKHAVLSSASGVQSYRIGELPYVIM